MIHWRKSPMKRNATFVGVWLVACLWGISGCGGAHDVSDGRDLCLPTVPLADRTMNLHVGRVTDECTVTVVVSG